MNQFCKNLLIGATVLGLSAGALAAPGDKGTDAQGKPPQAAMAKHGGEKFREHIAKRQAELHGKLKLNPSQEAAWKTYIAATTPPERAKRPDRAEWQKLTAPQRMERMLERMKQAESRMASHLAAMKTFYATLTPEQQKIFDDNVGKRRGHRHGHGGR